MKRRCKKIRKMPSVLIRLLVASGLSLFSGCTSLTHIPGIRAMSPGAKIVRKGDILQTSRHYGAGVYSHPFAIKNLPAGNVIVKFNEAGDWGGKEQALQETKGRSPMWSTDAGRTWNFGPAGMNEQQRSWLKYGGYFQGEGPLIRFNPQARKDAPEQFGMGIAEFDEENRISREWISTITLPPRPSGVFGYSHRGVKLANGNWMMVAYTRDKKTKKHRLFSLVSTNQGASFEFDQIIAKHQDMPTVEGISETDMLRTANGDIICVARAGQTTIWGFDPFKHMAPLLLCRSTDEGVTWSVKSTGIPGVNPHMELMSNGVIVLAYGRPGNNVMFSRDQGRSWYGEVSLTAADAYTSGYVALTSIGGNEVVCVYDGHGVEPGKIWLWNPPQANNRLLYKVIKAY